MTYADTLTQKIGLKHGTHTVIGLAEDHPTYGTSFVMRCDCGREKVVTNSHLCTAIRLGSHFKCECKSCGGALPEGQAAFNALYKKWVYRATKDRAYVSFDLTKEQVWDLIHKSCHYCGVEPYHEWAPSSTANGKIVYQGIDRVDPARGYTVENTVPCCGPCNKAKLSMSQEEFRNLICRIYHHWAKDCD